MRVAPLGQTVSKIAKLPLVQMTILGVNLVQEVDFVLGKRVDARLADHLDIVAFARPNRGDPCGGDAGRAAAIDQIECLAQDRPMRHRHHVITGDGEPSFGECSPIGEIQQLHQRHDVVAALKFPKKICRGLGGLFFVEAESHVLGAFTEAVGANKITVA